MQPGIPNWDAIFIMVAGLTFRVASLDEICHAYVFVPFINMPIFVTPTCHEAFLLFRGEEPATVFSSLL